MHAPKKKDDCISRLLMKGIDANRTIKGGKDCRGHFVPVARYVPFLQSIEWSIVLWEKG